MKTYTENDFVIGKNCYFTYGYWSEYSMKFDVNYSTILSKLIQVCGRFTENYNSDLFIEWDYICKKWLENPYFRYGKYVFGFRESGVDNMNQVLYHLNECGNSSYYYRAVYVLECSVVDGKFHMKLDKVII